MLLQLGDKGDNVKYLQYGLHILCCSPIGFDGEFGNGTLTAVKKFQSKYGLVSDGIVGDVTWNTLKNEIATIQSQLNKKGFNVGTVDGIAGAIISFQNKNGLTADGQVGPATWDILFDTVSGGNSYSRILKVTSPLMYGEDIRAIQSKLNSLGFNCGTADGYYGNDTKNAVINLQNTFEITADGIVGPTTWNYIFNSSPINEIINAVNNIGLFEGANFEIEALNAKSPEMLLSFSPIIKLYGESSFTSKLGNSPNNFINIAYSKDTIATNLFNSLNTAGVEHSISKNMIKSSISKLVAARNINDVIKYYIALEKDGTLIITLEASITTKTYPTLKLASTLYQRVIITVTPNLLPQPSGIRPKAVLTTPIGMELSDIPAGAIVDSSKVFDLIGSIIFAGVVIGAVYLGYAELVAGYTLIQSILEKVIWIIRA